MISRAVSLLNAHVLLWALLCLCCLGACTAISGVERVMKCTVSIRVKCDGSEDRVGTGFAVRCNDRKTRIITNCHVTGGAQSVEIRGEHGEWAASSPEHEDVHSDLALLAVPDGYPLDAVTLDTMTPPRVGETLYAIGYPAGLATMVNRGIASKVEEERVYCNMAVNPGNSGGPLFTEDGVVVGIISAKPGGMEGIAMAISSRKVKKWLDSIYSPPASPGGREQWIVVAAAAAALAAILFAVRQAGGASAASCLLLVREPEREDRRVKLRKKVTTAGRARNNDIVFSDPEVSASHLTLTWTRGTLMVKDIDSKNGTRINGETVGEHVLNKGDVLELGKSSLQIL